MAGVSTDTLCIRSRERGFAGLGGPPPGGVGTPGGTTAPPPEGAIHTHTHSPHEPQTQTCTQTHTHNSRPARWGALHIP